MAQSMTLPGLPLLGANSKPFHYKKSTKNGGPSKNMGFTENPFEDITRKNLKKNITLNFYETIQWNTKVINRTVELGPCSRKEIN